MEQKKEVRKTTTGAPQKRGTALTGAADVTSDVSAEVDQIDAILTGKKVIQKRKRKRMVNLCHACGYLGHSAEPKWHDEDEMIVDQWGRLGGGQHPAGKYPVAQGDHHTEPIHEKFKD